MNRNEIAEAVAQESGLSPNQAQAAVTAALDAIVRGLADGEKVSLAGFGTFEVRQRSARAGRNPQTGEAIEIAASVVPAFKPATAFKRAIAGD